jgi:hypothetical protein
VEFLAEVDPPQPIGKTLDVHHVAEFVSGEQRLIGAGQKHGRESSSFDSEAHLITLTAPELAGRTGWRFHRTCTRTFPNPAPLNKRASAAG